MQQRIYLCHRVYLLTVSNLRQPVVTPQLGNAHFSLQIGGPQRVTNWSVGLHDCGLVIESSGSWSLFQQPIAAS